MPLDSKKREKKSGEKTDLYRKKDREPQDMRNAILQVRVPTETRSHGE